ncbi:MAG: hypothetical protein RR186_06295 [Raoultibacter sp.]
MEKKNSFEGLLLISGVILLAGAVGVALLGGEFLSLQIVGWALIFAVFFRFANSVLNYHLPKSRVLCMIEFVIASAVVVASMACGSLALCLLVGLMIVSGCVLIVSYNLWESRLSWLVNFGTGIGLIVAGVLYATGVLDFSSTLMAFAGLRGANDFLLAFFKAKD